MPSSALSPAHEPGARTPPHAQADRLIAISRSMTAQRARLKLVSKRFERLVMVTQHTAQLTVERKVSVELLLRLIDEGHSRYTDPTYLTVYMNVSDRRDFLV